MKKLVKILIAIASLTLISNFIISCNTPTESHTSQESQDPEEELYYRETGVMLIETYNNIRQAHPIRQGENVFEQQQKIAGFLRSAQKTFFSSSNMSREELNEVFKQVNYFQSTIDNIFSKLSETGNTFVILSRNLAEKKLTYMYIEKIQS